MSRLPRILAVVGWLSTLMVLAGCRKQQDEPRQHFTQQIVVLSSINGIGDHGYNDVIIAGLEQAYLDCDDADMFFYDPASVEKAEQIVDDYLTEGVKDYERTLIILASSDYYDFLLKKLADPSLAVAGNADVLIFEVPELPESKNSLRAYSFLINMYEASYDAGAFMAQAGSTNPLIWLANDVDPLLQDAYHGFSDGYYSVTNIRSDSLCLSHDWSGYGMSDEAYQAMSDLSTRYDFIYPVMGGSNMGVFRYLREHPDGPTVAGMDVDQSLYSANVTGSVLKHIDWVIEKYISDWRQQIPLDHYNLYDSQSGYIEWSPVAR